MASKLFTGLFLVVAVVLIQNASAQLNFNLAGFASQKALTTSDWYLVTLPQTSAPSSDVTLSISQSCPTGVITSFNPSSFTFTKTKLQFAFTITTGTTVTTGSNCITFQVTGTNSSSYNQPSARSFTTTLRGLTVFYPTTTVTLGDQNNEITIDALNDLYPPNGLTITPNGTDLTFIPSSITLGPNGGATFRIRGDQLGSKLIQYTITGADSGIYQTTLNSQGISVTSFNFDVSRYAYTHYAGEVSTYHLGWVDHVASFSIQLDTVGTVIGSPMDFSTTPVRQYQYSFPTPSHQQIDFTLGGLAAVNFPSSANALSYDPVKRTIYVSPNGDSGITYFRNQTFPVSVFVRRVPIGGLTVYPYAADCTITPPSQTLKGGVAKTTSVVFLVTCNRLGNHNVDFVVSGVDVPIHSAVPASVPFNIRTNGFDIFYPAFTHYTNVESPPISVSIHVPPPSDVTLWPTGPDMIFNPPSLTFSPSVTRQTFTITSTATPDSPTSVTLDWLIVGTNKDLFTKPASKSISISLRPVAIYPPFVSTVPHGTTSQAYTIYSDVPGNLTINFLSAYGVVSPSAVTLTSEVPYARFNVTGRIRVSGSSLQYVLGGIDAGWYSPPAASTLTVPARVFVFDRLDIPVASTPGFPVNTTLEFRDRFATYYSLSTLYNPSKNVTVIPRARELQFKPAVWTFTPDTPKEGITFTVDGDVSGVHQAWFELAGHEQDVNYFANPALMTFTVPADGDVLSANNSPAVVISPNHLMIAMFVFFLASLLF